MTRGLLLVADGVTDSHFEYVYHRLREDAILVDVATPDGGPIRTALGQIRDAVPLADLAPARRYDLVAIPGGAAADHLTDDAGTRTRLVMYLDAGGVVCAIGEGIRLLLAVGRLDGRLVTAPSALHDDLTAAGAQLTDEAVTVDGQLVTVRDTDALPFGIVAALGSVVIPQGPAAKASERPHWDTSDVP